MPEPETVAGADHAPAAQHTALRETPLYPAHIAAGARMAPFGHWLMPIEYPTGTLAEHAAVRSEVGIFDVSHMGRLVVRGEGAVAALNALLANDLDRIGTGQAQYTLLCNDEGGVVDDLIVYRVGDDEVRIVPNAGNVAAVLQTLRTELPATLEITDLQAAEAMIAVQGPGSGTLLSALGLPDESELSYMSFTRSSYAGHPVVVCRTGYTGEHGFEVLVPVVVAVELWAALAQRATPCGLGARDTLRTEMGYPLHGQDISPRITPVEAGLSWAVGWNKPSFAGRDALVAQRAAGRPRALRGLLLSGRGVPRPGMAVATPAADGQTRVVGTVTSGTFSPTLRTGIALALVEPDLGFGTKLVVGIRNRDVAAEVVRTPFVDSSPK